MFFMLLLLKSQTNFSLFLPRNQLVLIPFGFTGLMSRSSFGLQILSESCAICFDALICASFLHNPDLIFDLLVKL
jgi:hypothetical protein